jgi:hypothetical protein
MNVLDRIIRIHCDIRKNCKQGYILMCDLEQLIAEVKFLCSNFNMQKKIAVTKQTQIHCRFQRVQDTAPLIPGH